MGTKSDKYLEETLFQAKRFGLHTSYIRKMETEYSKRLEKDKKTV